MADADEAQWIAWYETLEKPLYNLAYRWLWDAAESQDIVHEAFLRCWRIRDRVVAEKFQGLVYRTLLRLLSNRVRRRKLWRFVPFAEPEAPQSDGADPLVADHVRRALDKLADPMKQVLLLSELAGLSYKEIADVMNISEGTVGSRRNRALAALRETLQAAGVEWYED